MKTRGRRVLTAVAAVWFLNNLGVTVLTPLLPAVVDDLGGSPTTAGLLVSGGPLLYAVTSPAWGRLSDRAGRKPLIILGTFALGLATTGMGLSLLLPLASGVVLLALLCLRVAEGAVGAASGPPAVAVIADCYPPSERTSAMAVAGSFGALGMLAGPGAVAVFATGGAAMPLMVCGALMLAGAVFVTIRLPSDLPFEPTAATDAPLRWTDPRIVTILAFGILLWTLIAGSQTLLAYWLMDRAGLTGAGVVRPTGQLMLFGGIVALVMQIWVARGGVRARAGLFWAALLLISATATVGLAGTLTATIPGVACFGLAVGLALPSLTAAASIAVEGREQGSISGMMATIAGLGFIVGPLTGTALYQFHASAPFVAGLGASVGCLALVFSHAVRRAARRESEDAPTSASATEGP